MGSWQVFLSLENVSCECCVASPLKGLEQRNCGSFTGLTDQHMFHAQESVYRDGKQNRWLGKGYRFSLLIMEKLERVKEQSK